MKVPQWRHELAHTVDLIQTGLDRWRTGAIMYPTMPRDSLPSIHGWMLSIIDGLKNDADLWRWGEAHIVKPLEALNATAADAPDRVLSITKRLDRLANLLRDGSPSDRLVWDEQRDSSQAAARRLLDAVDAWRAEVTKRAGGIVVNITPTNAGSVVRVNPGPHLTAADLDRVASVGSAAPAMVATLRAWSVAENAEDGGPADALGFLRALADHGEAEAARRWPAPAVSAHDPARPEPDSLRAAHPALLARPSLRERFRAMARENARAERSALVKRAAGSLLACLESGASFDPADLETVAGIGAVGLANVAAMRAGCSLDAVRGFLGTLKGLGEAEALARWPVPAMLSNAGAETTTAEHRTPIQRAVDAMMGQPIHCDLRRDKPKSRPAREHVAAAVVALLKAKGESATVGTVVKALAGWNLKDAVRVESRSGNGPMRWLITAKREQKRNRTGTPRR